MLDIINKNTENKINSKSEKRILLVDDNELNRKVAKQMLYHMGFNIEIAENGQIAVEILEKENFNLVLMDVQMPVLNGVEATSTIRKSGNKTVIVAMTAFAMSDVKEMCIDAGMNDFITKPVQIKTLEEIIHKWM